MAKAYPDGEGGWVAVPFGSSFTLDGVIYPPGWADAADEDACEAVGLADIVEADAVAPGLRVTGRTLTDVDGVPHEVLETEALDLADLRATALVAARDEYDARRQSAMPWDFGATPALDDMGDAAGAAGDQTLQMRDNGSTDDLKNWLAVGLGATLAVVGGAPGTIVPLKTTANVWVQTPAADVLEVLVGGDGVQLSALQRGVAMLARFGVIKALILAAEDAEALAAIDLASGYPD